MSDGAIFVSEYGSSRVSGFAPGVTWHDGSAGSLTVDQLAMAIIVATVEGTPMSRLTRMSTRLPGRHVTRTRAVVAAIALIATACSGGSDESVSDVADIPPASAADESPASEAAPAPENAPAAQQDENDPSLPLLAAVGRNVAQHGDAGAFAVTMIAFDRGYSVEQIAAGEVIAVDGSIGIEEPAGPARGFLVSGPQGLVRRQTNVRLPEELNLRVEFLASTLNEIHGATWNRHEEAVRKAAAEFNEEFTPDHVRLSWAVVQLVSRGYTPEQAIEGLVFGEVTLDSPVCGRLPEPPAGPPTALDGCPPIKETTPSTTAPPTDQAPAVSDQPPAEDAGDIGFEPGTFTGSAIGLLGTGDGGDDGGDTTILLVDSADVEVQAESMTGTIELLVQATSAGDGDEGDLDDIVDDTICLWILISLDAVPLTDPDLGQFNGSATIDSNFEFGNCPPGGLPSIQTAPQMLAGDVDGDTLVLTLTADGETVSLTLTRLA